MLLFISLKLLYFVFCLILSSEIRNKKALRQHQNDVTDRIAHALKQLAITKLFTADTKPRKKLGLHHFAHASNILFFVNIIYFLFQDIILL